MERTLILAKPDAYARGLSGEILARFERKGLVPVALRVMTMTRELAERHYAEHLEKPFFGELADFITSGPLVAMVLEGPSAVAAARQVIGATNPLEAAPGSIRGDLAIATGENLVHGSDGPESAAREIGIFFPELSEARPRRRARPQRRALPRAGDSRRRRSRSAGHRFEEVEQGDPPAGRARERAGEGARGRARATARSCSAWTRSSRSTGASTASRRTRRRRAPRSSALRRDPHRRQRPRAGGAERRAADGGRSDGGDASVRWTARRSTGTSRPASGASAPGGYAIQGAGGALRSTAIDGDHTNVIGPAGRRRCSISTRRCWRAKQQPLECAPRSRP